MIDDLREQEIELEPGADVTPAEAPATGPPGVEEELQPDLPAWATFDSPVPREERYLNREITWLSFNGRVLQEARDPRLPLFERINFLAIFSSNLDEFFRVRVASLRSLLRLRKKKLKKLGFLPRRLLREIHFIVTNQQDTFGQIFRGGILPELEANGIFLLNERTLSLPQTQFLEEYFQRELRPHLEPRILEDEQAPPFLHQGRIYLVAELWSEPEVMLASERPAYGLLEVPSDTVPRFVVVPGEGHNVIFLDDVIRLFMKELFPDHEVGSAYAVRLSRDAELYLDDEFEGDLVEKIRKSLSKRPEGIPSRFLYDVQAPYALVAFMKDHLTLEDEDLIPGGRYHHLEDLFQFPRPSKFPPELVREELPPLPHPTLRDEPSVLQAVAKKDRILHFPYQSYDHVLRFLEEAADDPAVEEIWITLYRVASDSAVVKSLIRAAQRGARVMAFVEVKARFDEAQNLGWAEEMAEAGVHTVYSRPGLKVHAKLALLSRRDGSKRRLYAYLSTGNFNEKTARLYCDHGLLTADPRLTAEVHKVFQYLRNDLDDPRFEHLLVAPFFLRKAFTDLLDAEVKSLQAGSPAGVVLKMNSLADRNVMDLLYAASQAGLPMDLIVRGICSLKPGLPGLSENIRARSIVDRFLEHARVLRFVNGGDTRLFLSSADLMKRNLDRRVEVAFPLYDPDTREEVETILRLQLGDNRKARILDAHQQNGYVSRMAGEPSGEAQLDTYLWLESRLS
ncbi:polyphosphate kinase 1 [Gemmatimonadota bacterium]